MSIPDRGEVWLVDLGLAAKVRPCLVLSVPVADSDRALAALIPHTTAARATRFECSVPVGFLKPGAFDAQGIVTVPHAKLLRRLGTLRPEQLTEIEDAVCLWLGIKR
ncbi:MAG TPA: type II toxin-antitoxin system PemK/MazF family toxin [Thermoanaerobaculia bacterium]|nr:type II toxin-antitoxin system PemK/MazF family toxin [Thermoanaerobaculia bacterium]